MPETFFRKLLLAPEGNSKPVGWVQGVNTCVVLGGVAWIGWLILQNSGLQWDWAAVGAKDKKLLFTPRHDFFSLDAGALKKLDVSLSDIFRDEE